MPITSRNGSPRIVIAAPQGRSGKTTVGLGLCAALSARGLAVQPFKKGPDYIDPSWLSAAAGRPCRSLDPFFIPDPGELRDAFIYGAHTADLSLVEGNHGLYDSLEEDGQASTAAVSRTLQAPVVLVVNAARMTRSAAAMVRGYQLFEPNTNIAAVILNNTVPGRHEVRLRNAIERHCHIPVAGCLPRQESASIPDRHLGLVPHCENGNALGAIDACREAVERSIDLELILELARSAPALPANNSTSDKESSPPANGALPTIGVIRDRAFTFYYPENLEALAAAGAQLVTIDSFHDLRLPEIHALCIGGGFPEIFMEELAANQSLMNDIHSAVEGGLPVYAECGGLIYLSQSIHWGDRRARMGGVLPYQFEMTAKPQGHGYVLAEIDGSNPFFPAGSQLRGHEFHNSKAIHLDRDLKTAYRLVRGSGLGDRRDGLVYKNVLASYTHLHASGAPAWAPGLVARAICFMEGHPYV